MADNDAPNGFDDKLKQRAAAIADRPLETVPKNIVPPHHRIPNTPLAASTISFLLGSTFALSLLTFLVGGIPQFWWATWELGFFSASWAAFHWLEFAVTAGWNREKCSVDCETVLVS
jgi:protein-S-isoprenylcysteine O-methyltransferase